MSGFRRGLFAAGAFLALLDTSAAVDAAPAPEAARADAPVAPLAIPAALLKRPAAAPVRAPANVITVVHDDGPPNVRSSVPKRVPLAATTCKASSLKLAWPLAGTAGTNWTIHNYTDLDPSLAKKDWKGGVGDAAMNYDGHRGYDIVVGSFREMDKSTVLARAAAPGKVVAWATSNEDRHTSCISNDWNYVALQHDNGFITYYGHLKKNAQAVHQGQVVKAGDVLGTVGSSGCSTHPHLHFEVHDCDDKWFDAANVPGMWTVAPTQHEVSGVMDVMLRAGNFTSDEQIKDPQPNPNTVPKGMLGVGLSAGLKAGDELTFLVMNGTTPTVWTWKVSGRYGHRMPYWNIPVGVAAGSFLLVWLNDELKFQRNFTVK